MREDAVTILGARGSLPVNGADYIRYGGSTTCILVRLGDRTVVLDAGSGLLNLPGPTECSFLPEKPEPLPILITHPHIDHLLGLPLCPYCLKPGGAVDIYVKTRMGMGGQEMVDRLFSPPFWPVGTAQLPADIRFHELPETFDLGAVHIETMEGFHPGGVTLLRLSGNGKSVVLVTDCTLTEELTPAVRAFARDCDLLLIDGQYSEAEWSARKDFGHNTWTVAAQLGAACGAKRVRIIHHDPGRTDRMLDDASGELERICPTARFAYETEEIAL